MYVSIHIYIYIHGKEYKYKYMLFVVRFFCIIIYPPYVCSAPESRKGIGFPGTASALWVLIMKSRSSKRAFPVIK